MENGAPYLGTFELGFTLFLLFPWTVGLLFGWDLWSL
jgi:hypothetical protein